MSGLAKGFFDRRSANLHRNLQRFRLENYLRDVLMNNSMDSKLGKVR